MDETEFIKNQNNTVDIKFREKNVGKINSKGEWESYKKWNINFVDEFNDRLKNAINIYKKSIDSFVDEELDWDNYDWGPFQRNFFQRFYH